MIIDICVRKTKTQYQGPNWQILNVRAYLTQSIYLPLVPSYMQIDCLALQLLLTCLLEDGEEQHLSRQASRSRLLWIVSREGSIYKIPVKSLHMIVTSRTYRPSSRSPRYPTPALLTSTSIWPQILAAWSNLALMTSNPAVTSSWRTFRFGEDGILISSTVRAVATTRSPRARAEVTRRRPKPDEQPVHLKQKMFHRSVKVRNDGWWNSRCGYNLWLAILENVSPRPLSFVDDTSYEQIRSLST